VIRLAVRVAAEQAEMVLAELLELAPGGVEELEIAPDTIEYAVYGAPGELPSLPDLRAVAGEALVEISTTEVAEDWHERWKQFHRPILVSPPVGCLQTLPALHVRPPWEAPSEPRDAPVREIIIDPGQAFGTGAHATTRLCLELLLELTCGEAARGPLLDVGTGSGVLAIAAAALGYEPVLGRDHERESVHAASENALVNGVQIEVRRFELRSQPLPWIEGPTAPDRPLVVLANLLRPLLLELAATIPSAPAHMIISGLLCEEADEVAAAFVQRLGMHERLRRSGGEWAAVWLTAAGGSTSLD